jgi:hypothetical protein
MICRRAAALFDDGKERGADANMAKLFASESTWHAAEATFATYGGFAFAKEYDIERKWRKARLYQTASIAVPQSMCTNSEPTMPSSFATSPFSIRSSKKARSSCLSFGTPRRCISAALPRAPQCPRDRRTRLPAQSGRPRRRRRPVRRSCSAGDTRQLATRTLATSGMTSPCSDEGCAWTSPEIWPPHSISIWP